MNVQQEWLKVLGKGMVTLPKKWRDDLGLTEGDVIKAKKEGSKVVIEGNRSKNAPYKIYSDAEIDEFLSNDKIPIYLKEKVQANISALSR